MCGPRNLSALRTQRLLCWVRSSDPIGRVHCERLPLPAVQILLSIAKANFFLAIRQLIEKKYTHQAPAFEDVSPAERSPRECVPKHGISDAI